MRNPVADNFLESFRNKFASLVFSFYPEDPDASVLVFFEKIEEIHTGIINALFRHQKIKRIYYSEFLGLRERLNPIKDRYLYTFPQYIENVTGIVECEVRIKIKDFNESDWREMHTMQRYYFSHFYKWAATQQHMGGDWNKTQRVEQAKEVEMKEFFDRLLECYATEKKAVLKQVA